MNYALCIYGYSVLNVETIKLIEIKPTSKFADYIKIFIQYTIETRTHSNSLSSVKPIDTL